LINIRFGVRQKLFIKISGRKKIPNNWKNSQRPKAKDQNPDFLF
jgi:hypothetical protein